MALQSDTIIAVSSSPGRSVRGLVRISGDGLGTSLRQILHAELKPRRMQGSELRMAGGLALPCLGLFMPGPRSFTGEDVLELQLPGNPALLERLVQHLLTVLRSHDVACRLAEPGEFSQRAFLAGRIDLTRAEGIAATIGAESDAQLQAARLLRTGRLGQWAEELVETLAGLLALVEAGIDFVDQEDVVPIPPAELYRGLDELYAQLQGMLQRSRSWSALESLPWVVLVGAPNAGKSTLFNALLGHERAVTSDVAGTTRDVLSEPLQLETVRGLAEIMLVDVAGLDASVESMNLRMQEAVRRAMDRAELLLVLHDPIARSELEIPLPDSVPRLDVWTKQDLAQPKVEAEDVMKVSATTGEGLELLRHAIADRVAGRAVSLSGEMMALTPRHTQELRLASEALQQAMSMVHPQVDREVLGEMELVAESMREALTHLGAMGGQVSADDVIGRIFATFCIGK